MTFRDPHDAFQDAISSARLSADPRSPFYAGRYTYMGTENGVDRFKHTDTRVYLGFDLTTFKKSQGGTL